ncbi:hypothetical protein ACFO0K_14930 [Citricoccus alkalitolerans]|uniref:SMODS-associated NUDIX domain-containing protein n=1 Tax=Citricoccus alkalitolerans TaxID=246603 RepID=A0ABV8Y576_9MICC
MLVDAHNKCAAWQNTTGLPTAHPYGLMWITVPNAVARELGGLPGADKFRPRNGQYPVLSFNGVPLLTWRVSKDHISHFEDTALGESVTGSKRALFERRPVQPMFDFSELEGSSSDAQAPEAGEGDDLRQVISELVGEDAHVALLAYSSNQHALLSAYYGYAKLRDDDVVEYSFYEKIDLEGATARQLRPVSDFDASDSFDAGDLDGLSLRARTPVEGTPSLERPIVLPSAAEEDND